MNHTITIIYFTDKAGKARTIEFSLKNLILFAVSILILAVVSIVSISISIKLYGEKERLIKEIASINEEKTSLHEKIKDMEARINKIENIAKPADNHSVSSQSKKAEASKGAEDEAKKSGVNHVAGKGSSPVLINGFKTANAADGNQLVINFDLVKTDSSDAVMDGYVFIVGDYGGTYFSFPKDVEMKDGAPADFKKGSRFAIKWQKHIEQVFPSYIGSAIKMIRVFVFSADGELLVKKEASL